MSLSSSFPLSPQADATGARRSTSIDSSGSTSMPMSSFRRTSSVGSSSSSLPPPPNVTPHQKQSLKGSGSVSNSLNGVVGGPQQTNYALPVTRSMTIDEMRALHRRALNDAEAKQTELRLVLASRYRELVGSSDEVTKMRERAQELHQLVTALPNLMEKLILVTSSTKAAGLEDEKEGKIDLFSGEDNNAVATLELRRQLSNLPRVVHRALDNNNVHDATQSLINLFRLIAERTDEYPLATSLTFSMFSLSPPKQNDLDTMVKAQMRMTFLYVQTLPSKIVRISKQILNMAASFDSDNPTNSIYGAEKSAAALSALHLLEIRESGIGDRAVGLLDLYIDSKAKLLQSLLNNLHTTTSTSAPNSVTNVRNGAGESRGDSRSYGANNAEEIMSKIVLILQYDIVLHPYQIFVLRRFASVDKDNDQSIMESLPMFPAPIVRAKISNFLAAHLPLIRTKVKSILVDIAGTTASALGKIRQSLYDKTDGIDCMDRLDSNGVCTWDEAVSGLIDVQTVLHSSHVGVGTGPMSFVDDSSSSSSVERKFSLWGVLFSTTFSSLVHSLLTSSFQSVHTKVVSTLRQSLTNAPTLFSILPHEAHRNMLYIASELDTALLKVSDDAHELLVHAEERQESECRLRQSLYVQTCEIMGRLICELRHMLSISDSFDGVKQLIVGRLCHFLKFRLTVLPILLDPNSSPAVLHGSTGMISFTELSSAFDLADDNDDGLITFQEAMEAVDSAFSGTQFHGAQMVRETLLLPTSESDLSLKVSAASGCETITPQNVTLDELTLLLARGLRHEATADHSALGTVQSSLDRMMTTCFDKWAESALKPHVSSLSSRVASFVTVACASSEREYRRLYGSSDVPPPTMSTTSPLVSNVSPHLVSFLLDVSFTMNRSVCPSDTLLPVPSVQYALSMGVDATTLPRMIDLIRWALIKQGLDASVFVMKEHIEPALQGSSSPSLMDGCPSAIAQLKNDLSFLQHCFFHKNRHGFGNNTSVELAKSELQRLGEALDVIARRVCDASTLREIEQRQERIVDVCDLFLSSLFGENTASVVARGERGHP